MTHPGSAHIWALVSCFPGEKRRKRLLLMLQAYIDESQEGDIFVIAGYVSTAERWVSFSDDWQELLDTRSPHYKWLEEFKTTRLDPDSQIDMEQAGWYYNVIEDHVMAAISVHFPVSALRNAVRRLPRLERIRNVEKLENPYFWAYRAIIDLLIQNQKQLGLNTPIDFIFDEKAEKGKCIEGWDNMKSGATGERAILMGDTPIFRDSMKALPLQAADLWAGWIRMWAQRPDFSKLHSQLSFPWKAKRLDLLRIAFWHDEQGIYENLCKLFDAEFSRVERGG